MTYDRVERDGIVRYRIPLPTEVEVLFRVYAQCLFELGGVESRRPGAITVLVDKGTLVFSFAMPKID